MLMYVTSQTIYSPFARGTTGRVNQMKKNVIQPYDVINFIIQLDDKTKYLRQDELSQKKRNEQKKGTGQSREGQVR
jgi:hypothetical protein